jgi:hypothetical protein
MVPSKSSSPEDAASKPRLNANSSAAGAGEGPGEEITDSIVSFLRLVDLIKLIVFPQTQKLRQNEIPSLRTQRCPKRRRSDDDSLPLPPARRNLEVEESDLPKATSNGGRQRVTRKSATLGSWADPKSPDWDIIRVLNSEECLIPDPLLKPPPRNYVYIDSNNRLKDPFKYAVVRDEKPLHPKLVAHINNGTETRANRLYYQDMPLDRCLPIAGIIRDKPDPRDAEVNSVVREDLEVSSSLTELDGTVEGCYFPEHLSILDPNPILTRDPSPVGRELSRKAINQARNTRSHQSNARRRLGERDQESATRPPSLRSTRKRNPEGLS